MVHNRRAGQATRRILQQERDHDEEEVEWILLKTTRAENALDMVDVMMQRDAKKNVVARLSSSSAACLLVLSTGLPCLACLVLRHVGHCNALRVATKKKMPPRLRRDIDTAI